MTDISRVIGELQQIHDTDKKHKIIGDFLQEIEQGLPKTTRTTKKLLTKIKKDSENLSEEEINRIIADIENDRSICKTLGINYPQPSGTKLFITAYLIVKSKEYLSA